MPQGPHLLRVTQGHGKCSARVAGTTGKESSAVLTEERERSPNPSSNYMKEKRRMNSPLPPRTGLESTPGQPIATAAAPEASPCFYHYDRVQRLPGAQTLGVTGSVIHTKPFGYGVKIRRR